MSFGKGPYSNYSNHSGLLTAPHVLLSPPPLAFKEKLSLSSWLCTMEVSPKQYNFIRFLLKNEHNHLSNSSPNPYLPSVLNGHSCQTKLDLQSPLAHRSNPKFSCAVLSLTGIFKRTVFPWQKARALQHSHPQNKESRGIASALPEVLGEGTLPPKNCSS